MPQYYHIQEDNGGQWDMHQYDVSTDTAPSTPVNTFSIGEPVQLMEVDAAGDYYALMRDTEEVVKFDASFNEVWRTNIGSEPSNIDASSGGIAVGPTYMVIVGDWAGAYVSVVNKDTGVEEYNWSGQSGRPTGPVINPSDNSIFYVLYTDDAFQSSCKHSFDGTLISQDTLNDNLGNDFNSDVQTIATAIPSGGISSLTFYRADGDFAAERGAVAGFWDSSNTLVDEKSDTTSSSTFEDARGAVTTKDNGLYLDADQLAGRYTESNGTFTAQNTINFTQNASGYYASKGDFLFTSSGDTLMKADYVGGGAIWETNFGLTFEWVGLGAIFPTYPENTTAWASIEAITATQIAANGMMNVTELVELVDAIRVQSSGLTNDAILSAFNLSASQPSVVASMRTPDLANILPVEAAQAIVSASQNDTTIDVFLNADYATVNTVMNTTGISLTQFLDANQFVATGEMNGAPVSLYLNASPTAVSTTSLNGIVTLIRSQGLGESNDAEISATINYVE